MVISISGKSISIKNIKGPTGVRGRNSDNTLIKEKLGWAPTQPLKTGVEETYKWIVDQMKKKQKLESKSFSVA
jgi:dTDP-D-glucose 4,6-dehydratase